MSQLKHIITCHTITPRAATRHTHPHVARHTSHAPTCCTSHVTRHTSHVTRTQIADEVNERRRARESRNKVVLIQGRLQGMPSNHTLVIPGRRYMDHRVFVQQQVGAVVEANNCILSNTSICSHHQNTIHTPQILKPQQHTS